jgi:CheY-like chemotaxis protein
MVRPTAHIGLAFERCCPFPNRPEVIRRRGAGVGRHQTTIASEVGAGRQAIDRFIAAGDYDLVLMDLQMPEVDGCAADGRLGKPIGKAALLRTIYDGVEGTSQV